MNFSKIARKASSILGSSYMFFIAFAFVVLWALSGPFLKFSSAWQLSINTTTTIITFLAVFLIQHSQNIDTKALHLKMDEMLKAIDEADNKFLRAERVDSKELEELDKLHEDVVESPSSQETDYESRRKDYYTMT